MIMETLKKILLTLFLVIGINFISINSGETVNNFNNNREITELTKKIIKPNFNVDKAIHTLKTEPLYLKGDLKQLDSLTYNLLDKFINDTLYSEYKLPKKDLISCIQSLSIFESGKVTRKGSMPFKSSLFVESNNPFGIKHTKGKYTTKLTTEFYNGERHRKYLRFQYYNSMNGAIDDLMRILNLKRYNKLHQVKTKKEFFRQLRLSGYHTASYSYSNSLTKYAVKLSNLKNNV